MRAVIATLVYLTTAATAQTAGEPSEATAEPKGLEIEILEEASVNAISVGIVEPDSTRTRIEVPQKLIDLSLSLPIASQIEDIVLVTKEDLARFEQPGADANVIDFVDLPDAMEDAIAGLTRSCERTGVASYCVARDRLVAIQPGLDNPSPKVVQCSEAANAAHRAWQADTEGWHSTTEAGAWEDACLAPLDAPSNAAGSSLDPAIMSAIGVLSFHEKPFCSGLFIADGLFVTAQHCYRSGGLSVRQAGSNEIRTLDRVDSNALPGVPNDWAVFRVTGGAPLVVQATEFSPPGDSTDVYPVGLSLVAASRNAPLADITQTIRAPRDNMCPILFEIEGCLHLACQTMPGFSGAPVFLGRAASEQGVPKVVGLLSGGSDGGSCKGPTVPRVTFAVPVSRIIVPTGGE